MIRNTLNPYDPRILAFFSLVVACAVECFWMALTVPLRGGNVQTWEGDK